MTAFSRSWRAIIGSLAGLFGGERTDAWVEPSNAITRAILAGHASSLATFTFAPAPDLAIPASASAPGVSATAFVPAPPADWDEPAPASEPPHHVFEDDLVAEETSPAAEPGKKAVELAA